MKITKKTDGTIEIEGTADELAAYAKAGGEPYWRFMPIPYYVPYIQPTPVYPSFPWTTTGTSWTLTEEASDSVTVPSSVTFSPVSS